MARLVAAAALALPLMACGCASAELRPERVASPPASVVPVVPPGPAPAAPAPEASESGSLVAVDSGPELCGVRDPVLDRVAEQIVARRAAGADPPEPRDLDGMLRTAGSAHVWPTAWAVGPVADPALGWERLVRWAGGQRVDGVARCGVALWRESPERWHAAAVRVDALARLTKLPAAVRSHAWVELEAESNARLDSVHVVLLGPRGRPKRVLASSDGRIVRSRFTLDQPGRWLVQLVGWGPTGPVPLLETSLTVEGADATSGAPADVLGPLDAASVRACAPRMAPRPDPPAAGGDVPRPVREPLLPTECARVMLQMLNAARRAEGARPLVGHSALDRLAADHAVRMARARRLGHDVGDGTPAHRIEEAGIDADVVGENAASAVSTEDAHRVLWSSPSHRENMLDERYQRVGIGMAFDERGTLWVAELFAN